MKTEKKHAEKESEYESERDQIESTTHRQSYLHIVRRRSSLAQNNGKEYGSLNMQSHTQNRRYKQIFKTVPHISLQCIGMETICACYCFCCIKLFLGVHMYLSLSLFSSLFHLDSMYVLCLLLLHLYRSHLHYSEQLRHIFYVYHHVICKATARNRICGVIIVYACLCL